MKKTKVQSHRVWQIVNDDCPNMKVEGEARHGITVWTFREREVFIHEDEIDRFIANLRRMQKKTRPFKGKQ